MTKVRTEKTHLIGKDEEAQSSFYLNKNLTLNFDAPTKQASDRNTSNGDQVTEPTTEDGVSENGHKDEKSQEEPRQEFKLRDVPRKSLIVLALVALGNFLLGIEFYFIVPFYPQVGKSKGMSDTVLGFLFCVVHLTVFITSPVFGNYMEKLGPRFIYVTGLSVGGIVTILFGLVGMCDPGASFIATSFVCRFLVGVAISAFVTVSFAILTNEFPHHVSRVFGMTEVANGFGFMAGPALGGGLYEAGGFGLPFYVVGALVIFNTILLVIFMPPPLSKIAKRPGGIATLVKSPIVLISMLNIMTGTIGVAFLESTLTFHLSQFDLSTGLVGLMFTIVPFVYGCTSPLVGYVADTMNIQHIQFYSGTICTFIGNLLIGPSYLLVGMPSKIWVVAICLILLGYSFGACNIPSLKCMMTGAVEIGFPNNLNTYGLISGVFYSSMCFGGFIGNILGGVLVDNLGYERATTVISFLGLAVTVISFTFFTIRNHIKKREEQKTDQVPKKTPVPWEKRGSVVIY